MEQQPNNNPISNNIVPPTASVGAPTPVATPASTPPKSNKKWLIILGAGGVYLLLVMAAIVGYVSIRSSGEKSFLVSYMTPEQARSLVSNLVYTVEGILGICTMAVLLWGVFKKMFRRPDDTSTLQKAKLLMIGGGAATVLVIFLMLASGLSLQQVTKEQTALGKLQVYALEGNKEYLVDKDQSGNWLFYTFLTDQKKYVLADDVEQSGLAAPVTLRLDARDLIDTYARQREYTVLQKSWDVSGDGKYEPANSGDIVQYRYEKPGNYGAVLKVTFQKLKPTSAKDKQPFSVIFLGPGQTTKEKNVQTQIVSNLLINVSRTRPNIKLKAVPTSGGAPLKVNFDASGTVDATENGTLQYDWDFNNDGLYTEGQGSIIDYTFNDEGQYPVYLRVKNSQGVASYQRIDILVSSKEMPYADFSMTPEKGRAPLKVIFDASLSKAIGNSKIKKYSWNFGDGSNLATQKIVKHEFKVAGEYIVNLNVTDDLGRVGTTQKKLVVASVDSGARAEVLTTPAYTVVKKEKTLEGELPFSVQFDGSASGGDLVLYEWDFNGDGVFEESGVDKTSYEYRKPGKYRAILRVTDTDGITAQDSVNVTVNYSILKAILVTDTQSGEMPLTVSFDASSSRYADGNIERFKWDFGDKTPILIADSQVSHEYTSAGQYVAKVTALTADGKEDTTSINIIVTPKNITARFQPSIRQGEAPLTVSFDASSSSGEIARYEWTFGDGEKASDVNTVHTFINPGSYEVVLKAYDANNNVSTYKEVITVTAPGEVQ